MKANVNPFTREVEITFINNDVTHIEKLFFDELDEWQGFEAYDDYYDVHFLYEDNKFYFEAYKVNKDIHVHCDYRNNLIKEITILLPIINK